MDKVLFVTQPLGDKAACGIGLIGKLLVESLVNSTKYEFIAVYTDNNSVLESKILEHNPKFIIYNYHTVLSSWLHEENLSIKYSHIHHILIDHEMYQERVDSFQFPLGFKYLIIPDKTLLTKDNIFTVNRLLPKYNGDNYKDDGVPKIGFQGFAQKHKGLYKIAYIVQKEYDEAIIRLHIPFAKFFDPQGIEARARVEEVRNIITKPNIKLEVSHDLKSTKELLDFLSENTVNCYFNDNVIPSGIASSPDYALAVNRPLAVTKSNQLVHLRGLEPSICIEDNSLKDIISFGLKPTKRLRELGQEENVIKEYEEILNQINGNDRELN